jgi:hypothetical protein
MKLKNIVIVAATLMLVAVSAQAQQSWRDRFNYTSGGEKYFANEFTLDAFATYNKFEKGVDDVFDRSWRHGHFGGGVGLNYFFLRNLGVGVDTYFNDQGVFAKNIAGSAILRFPIGDTGFAPYIFGGLGGRFSPVEEWTGHGGAGIELRLNPDVGIFSDIRYTVADKTADEMLVRAGIRISLNAFRRR